MFVLRIERILKRYLLTHVHNSIINNKQEMGATQTPTMAEWVNKMGHINMMGYYSALKKGNSVICYNMGES